MSTFSRRIVMVGALGLSFGATSVHVASAQVQSKSPVNIDAAGVAIKGYDPIAYFTVGAPTQGVAQFAAVHEGATFHFATAENKALFDKEPARYAPQYGGYCAFAAAKGSKAEIDPTQWKVVEGKLYLNYNAAVSKTWSSDIPGFIKTADANWPTLKSK